MPRVVSWSRLSHVAPVSVRLSLLTHRSICRLFYRRLSQLTQSSILSSMLQSSVCSSSSPQSFSMLQLFTMELLTTELFCAPTPHCRGSLLQYMFLRHHQMCGNHPIYRDWHSKITYENNLHSWVGSGRKMCSMLIASQDNFSQPQPVYGYFTSPIGPSAEAKLLWVIQQFFP